jgi:ATP-dependent RNA helicase DDX1
VEGGSCGFDVNGKSYGNAFAPLPDALQGVALFPCVSMRNAQLAVSFSELKFPKEGFVPISQCPQLQAGLSKDQNQYESTKKRQKSGRSVSAIILEPARDLAEQTHDCIESYARYLQDPHVKCALLIGGINTKEAEQALRQGDVDIVTGTPLKVWDLVKRGIMDVDACRFFTLDEADRFIETDDVATCLKIFEKLPKGASATARDRRLQVAFFSATLHSEAIKELSRKVCDNPTWCRHSVPSLCVSRSRRWRRCGRTRVCAPRGSGGAVASTPSSRSHESPPRRRHPSTPSTRCCPRNSRVCPRRVDLKGEKHLPDSVKHLVVPVDPSSLDIRELAKQSLDDDKRVTTDSVHRKGDLDKFEAPQLLKGDVKAVLETSSEDQSEVVKLAKPALFVKLFDSLKMEQCLVFCRTNLDCDLFERYLNKIGGSGTFRGRKESGKESPYACCVLAGMRSMHERRRNLEAFKAGDVKILIATDVAARGIDVQGLPCVVNVTLPDVAENYVHRIGRVGRADKVGLAVSLVSTVKEKVWFCQRGKKPPQKDTRDFDKGGNCVWYDEPDLLTKVEAKLGQQVPRMDAADLTLPPELRDVVFGEVREGTEEEDKARTARLANIAGDVDKLKDMEVRSQQAYFMLRELTSDPMEVG